MKFLLLFVYLYAVSGDKLPENVVSNLNNIVKWNSSVRRYKPEWSDLDTRPLPEWYDRAKIGIFIHWGVYSVPGFKTEWFWNQFVSGHKVVTEYMRKNYPPGFTYQEFAPGFTAEFFDPDQWAELFKKAGAKYVVLTSKHHEGFTLFPSKHSFSWNSVDVGPHRDLVDDISKAVRNKGLEFGVYYSLFEWFNPLYLKDKDANFSTFHYVHNKLRPDIEQLVLDYHPSVIWSDGDWEPHDTYWNSTDILAWLYNDSPVKDKIVVNDRWGIDTYGKHGDFYNVADSYDPGVLQNHKWESAFSIDKDTWGYRRNINISDILTPTQLIKRVVTTVSCGGNALINIGPTKEGTIAPIFQDRLLALGQWLGINGEAIYDSSPWLHQNDSANGKVWYTCNKTKYNPMNATAPPQESDQVTAIYAIILSWPASGTLKIRDMTPFLLKYKVQMLGEDNSYLQWTIKDGIASISLPDHATVRSKYAWTLKFTKIK